jgi:hypothetical protein
MLPTVINVLFVFAFAGLLSASWWLYSKTDNSSDKAAWDSGYHTFMAFSGFLVAGPIIGLLVSCFALYAQIAGAK